MLNVHEEQNIINNIRIANLALCIYQLVLWFHKGNVPATNILHAFFLHAVLMQSFSWKESNIIIIFGNMMLCVPRFSLLTYMYHLSSL